MQIFVTYTDSSWVEDMGRQESPQLIERKGQVDTDAQETSRASKYYMKSDKQIAGYSMEYLRISSTWLQT